MSRNIFFLILLLSLTASCAKASREAPEAVSSTGGQMEAQPAPVQTTEPVTISLTTRKLIRTADVELEVQDYDATLNTITAMAKEAGGFLSNSSVSKTYDDKKSGYLTLRVPSEKYEAVIDRLKKIDTLISLREGSQDITEEYIDVEARLANSRRLEQRLQDILKTEAGKLSDVLDVERELARVREDIERAEGRKRYLDNQSDLATINVTLYEPQSSIPAKRSIFSPLRRAMRSSGEILASSLATLIVAIVAILPWLLIIGGIVFAFLKIRRWRKAHTHYEVMFAPPSPSPQAAPPQSPPPPPPPAEEESKPQ